jgi:hypothetical protein
MELEGRVWKSKRYWLVEVPGIDVMTQGRTRAEALEMIRDAVIELIRSYFKSAMGRNFDINVNDYKKGVIGITTTDNKLLLALSLRRQREKSGSTVREAAERLGAKFPNAYAQYEKGKIRISLDQYDKLLQAANPFRHSLLRIV